MLLWINESADQIPAWVQIVIASGGVVAGGVVASFAVVLVALWSHLPKRQKIEAFVLTEDNQVNPRWIFTIVNLGPKDIIDINVSEIPSQHNHWLTVFEPPEFVHAGMNSLQLIKGWRGSFLGVGNRKEVDIGAIVDIDNIESAE